ncbi:MAG: 50S ribosomal protein L9 [Pseudomonadota bacterium]|nr:50S ribosomal protein L9 [Pseudomonadota bacterium]
MNIILVESVNHLGRSGEVVKVKPGYARNFLIPKGLALVANKANMAVLDAKQAEIQAREAEKKAAAEALQKELEVVKLDLKVETNEENQLFGSVGVNEVSKLIADAGHEVNKRDIVLPQGQVEQLGSYPVEIICHVDVIAKLTLNVIK